METGDGRYRRDEELAVEVLAESSREGKKKEERPRTKDSMVGGACKYFSSPRKIEPPFSMGALSFTLSLPCNLDISVFASARSFRLFFTSLFSFHFPSLFFPPFLVSFRAIIPERAVLRTTFDFLPMSNDL